MISGKYVIHYSPYPFGGFYREYATNHFLPFLFKFMAITAKYPIVNVEFRDMARMGGDGE